MRRCVQGLLVLGLAVLPLPAQAQYMAPIQYMTPAQYAAPGYYNGQQMPVYAPAYPYAGQPMTYYRPQVQWPQPAYYYPMQQPPPAQPYYVNTSRYQSPAAFAAPAPRPRVLPVSARRAPTVSAMPVGEPVEEEVEAPAAETPEPKTAPKVQVRETVPARVIPHDAPVVSAVRKKAATVEALPPAAETKPAAVEAKPAAVEEHAATDEACATARRRRFQIFGDALYWNVHNSGVPYAQAFDGVDPFLSVPRGPVGVADLEYKAGYRAGVGYSLCENSWLVGTFTYFQNSTQSDIAAQDPNVLHSNLLFPNTVNAAFTPLAADADYNVRLITGDVDYKHAIVDSDCLKLNWLAGVRYGSITQTLNADYLEVQGAETIRSRIDFDGIGPRAGIEGEYKLRWGLFGYGKGVLDLLAGRFAGQYEQRDVFGGLVAHTDIAEKRLVPITEFEVGGGWMGGKGMIRVSAGYSVNLWFNALTTPGLVRGIQDNNFTTNGNNFRDTLSFDGLVGHFEFRY